jgi:hypothetical protein
MDKTPRTITRLHPVSDGRTQNPIEPGLFRGLLQQRTSHRSGKEKRPLHQSGEVVILECDIDNFAEL